jgi:hypothetical protein
MPFFKIYFAIRKFVTHKKLIRAAAPHTSSSRRHMAQTATRLFSARPSQLSSRVERTATRDLRRARKEPTIRLQRSRRPPYPASERRAGTTTEGHFFNIVLGRTRGFVRRIDPPGYDPSVGDGRRPGRRESNAGEFGAVPPSGWLGRR